MQNLAVRHHQPHCKQSANAPLTRPVETNQIVHVGTSAVTTGPVSNTQTDPDSVRGPKPTLRPLGLASRWQRQSSTLCALCSFKEKVARKNLAEKRIFPFHADSKRFGVFFCFCFLGRELAVALSTFHIALLSRHPRFCDNTRKKASWRGKKEEQKASKK